MYPPHPCTAGAVLAAGRRTLTSRSLRSSSRTLRAAWGSSSRAFVCLRQLPPRSRHCPPAVSSNTPIYHKPNPCRAYHSYDHPAPPGPFSEAERAVLTAAYKHVPQHGFSRDALALGARDAGYLDISITLLPDGVFTLVQWHLVAQREALAARSKALFGSPDEATNVSVLDKAEALAWERLSGNAAIITRLQEALAIMAQPTYVPASLKELALLVDEIWFLSGDEAVDPTWYTKRASLSAIYATTELFMTSDHSPDFQDTRQFLRRRFQEANELGGAVRSVGEWLGFTATAGMNVLRSKGLRI